MKEKIDILLPFMMQSEEAPEEKSLPYELTGLAMNELHRRSHEKIKRLFPDWPDYETAQRINAEVQSLWQSPYAYALLVADDAQKRLAREGIQMQLAGKWSNSYYAFLMDMLCAQPEQTPPESFQDSPLVLTVEKTHERRCLDKLFLAARKWGYYLSSDGRLLPPDEKEALSAPVILLQPQ